MQVIFCPHLHLASHYPSQPQQVYWFWGCRWRAAGSRWKCGCKLKIRLADLIINSTLASQKNSCDSKRTNLGLGLPFQFPFSRIFKRSVSPPGQGLNLCTLWVVPSTWSVLSKHINNKKRWCFSLIGAWWLFPHHTMIRNCVSKSLIISFSIKFCWHAQLLGTEIIQGRA